MLPQSTNGEVTISERAKGDNCNDVDQNFGGENFLLQGGFYQDLEKCDLLHLLSLDELEQIVITFDWYRNSSLRLDD